MIKKLVIYVSLLIVPMISFASNNEDSSHLNNLRESSINLMNDEYCNTGTLNNFIEKQNKLNNTIIDSLNRKNNIMKLQTDIIVYILDSIEYLLYINFSLLIIFSIHVYEKKIISFLDMFLSRVKILYNLWIGLSEAWKIAIIFFILATPSGILINLTTEYIKKKIGL